MTGQRRACKATPAVLLDPRIRLHQAATVEVMLGYDADDPWTVCVDFRSRRREWVRWEVSRELLATGLLMPAGGDPGDVTVTPFPTGVLMEIRNSDERAEFLLDADDVGRFLAYSYAVCPAGAERLDWEVEELALFASAELDELDGG